MNYMKIQLLTALLFVGVSAFAQSPVSTVRVHGVGPDEFEAQQKCYESAKREAGKTCINAGWAKAVVNPTPLRCTYEYHSFGYDETCEFAFRCEN
jgi:hypothetical protein